MFALSSLQPLSFSVFIYLYVEQKKKSLFSFSFAHLFKSILCFSLLAEDQYVWPNDRVGLLIRITNLFLKCAFIISPTPAFLQRKRRRPNTVTSTEPENQSCRWPTPHLPFLKVPVIQNPFSIQPLSVLSGFFKFLDRTPTDRPTTKPQVHSIFSLFPAASRLPTTLLFPLSTDLHWYPSTQREPVSPPTDPLAAPTSS